MYGVLNKVQKAILALEFKNGSKADISSLIYESDQAESKEESYLSAYDFALTRLMKPILEVISNVDELLENENPVSLRYFHYNLHDF